MAAPGLGPRDVALQQLSETNAENLDLLVVGGGVTGAGVALDAASRGMSVALVERFDFASGTSSKSSKLVHGGLRYLEQREFGLMREAAAERDLLRRLAPHLVEPIPFALPVTSRMRRAQFGVGLWAYDALATFRNLHIHRYLDREETERLVPVLPPNKVRGGFLFYDCKTDDARLVIELLVQARRLGAIAANYAAVRDISSATDSARAVVEDTLTGDTFEIESKRVVVAGGVWADDLEAITRQDAAARLTPSKGIHLLFRPEHLPLGDTAAFIPDTERRRMLFVIPWLDAVIVGTTDTHYEGNLDRPAVEEEDRSYCLDALNAIFDLGLGPEHIVGAYAGLRPLIAGKAGATADLSRRHLIYEMAPNVLGITGGKLTIYRRMARDVVDRVAADLPSTLGKSRTRWIRLGCSNLGALRAAADRRGAQLGLSSVVVSNLVRAYGDRALSVLDRAAETGAIEPLAGPSPAIVAEAHYAVESEMAVQLSDLLARRTRLALTDPPAGIGPSSHAPDVMAQARGWSRAEANRQALAYRMEIERERNLPLGPEARVPEARAAETAPPSARTG